MRSTIAVLLLSISVSLSAQDLELGLWGGISFYSGDLSPEEFGLYLKTLDPAGGILLRYNPVDPLSVELGLNLGQVHGEDGITNDVEGRMLNFRTRITELSLKANWNFLRLGNPKGVQAVPYLMIGGSVFRFNPEARFDGNWIELQPLGTQAQGVAGYENPYSLTEFSLMAGGGLKFIISKRMTIGLELGGRRTSTDFLDDISDTEVNYLDVLNNGSLAATLSNPLIVEPEPGSGDIIYTRGGEFEDWFFMGGVSFSFAFGGGDGVNSRGIGCPTF